MPQNIALFQDSWIWIWRCKQQVLRQCRQIIPHVDSHSVTAVYNKLLPSHCTSFQHIRHHLILTAATFGAFYERWTISWQAVHDISDWYCISFYQFIHYKIFSYQVFSLKHLVQLRTNDAFNSDRLTKREMIFLLKITANDSADPAASIFRATTSNIMTSSCSKPFSSGDND